MPASKHEAKIAPAKIKMADGTQYAPKNADEVKCDVHNLTTTWGALDGIQQLALSEGLDTGPEHECLLAAARRVIA